MSESRNGTVKTIIDETVNDLMKQKELTKITVQDICKQSGVNRQLFYYYYRDKYDCVNQKYKRDVDDIVGKLSLDAAWEQMATDILEYIRSNQKYYQTAFRYQGQNSFFDYFNEYSYRLNEAVVASHIPDMGFNDDILSSVRFYNNGCVLSTYQWVQNGMVKSPHQVARMMQQSIPANLKEYYR